MKPSKNSNYNPDLETIDFQENLEVTQDERSGEFSSDRFSFND